MASNGFFVRTDEIPIRRSTNEIIPVENVDYATLNGQKIELDGFIPFPTSLYVLKYSSYLHRDRQPSTRGKKKA